MENSNCNPISWGHKIVYTTLLGENRESWNLYDGSEVAKRYDGPRREILADQVSHQYANVAPHFVAFISLTYRFIFV